MENEREVRLRRQLEGLVRTRLGNLEQDISRLQREVNEWFTSLLEKTDAASTIGDSDESLQEILGEVASLKAEADAAVEAATASAASAAAAVQPQPTSVDVDVLRDAIVRLDEQTTQADVLNTLVEQVSTFAPRVVLFVVKGNNALAWAARGFDDGVSNTSIRGLSVSLQSPSVLSTAFETLQTARVDGDSTGENDVIFSRLGDVRPSFMLAVPLKVRGKSAAVLYADSGRGSEAEIKVPAIELLVHTGGRVVELVSLRSRVDGAKQAQAQVTPAAASGPLRQPTGAIAQPLVADSGAIQPPAPAPPPPAAVEMPPPVAVSIPPVEVAVPVEPPPPAKVAEPAPAAVVPERKSGPLDEEEKQHNDARRFARLLVSEIKLYNEQKVAEGRRNSDLYDRLKEDIDRSRQMYEKRVTAQVAAKFDYFYDELVNTLAEGDSARLGSDHPGPAVRV